ncbi:MAG: SDR family oxidoreductase [Halieaceae bacterium]|jgi:NAD(P)-dependent dehydrogenase (short-subunit alcohol dehydrogenase family)|nr:SDR family oxidoreductase [Halieaceae bacterium]
MSSLNDKIAVVTGTSRGVGVGIAHELLKAGATVIGCSRSPLDAMPGAADIPGGAERSEQWVCDQEDWRQIQALIQRVVDTYGRIDILVNNAGGTIPAPHPEAIDPLVYTFQGLGKVEDEIERTVLFHSFAVRNNLLNPMIFSLLAAREMKNNDSWSSIINISSGASNEGGSPSLMSYGAAKSGLNQMTSTMAQEWGKYKIRTNCIALGATVTDGFESFVLTEDDKDGKEYFKNVPLGRGGRPEEIGKICVFLSSSQAQVINGATLKADGGMLPGALYDVGLKAITDLLDK